MNDILDSQGKNLNFLTNQPYSEEYKKLAKKWSQLPMYNQNVSEFFNLLENKQVILLSSGTGSGKTVIVPKFFLKYIINNNIPGKIAITNPKILTTHENADYGARTLDVKLGEEVGYKYKGAPSNSMSDKTKLLYVTDGLLYAIIANRDKLLSEFAGVIIDEAHERNIQIDLLLKLLKEIVLVRKDFKLIIMSATVNAQIFRNYFNIENINYGEIEISGKPNYPITEYWLDKDIEDDKYMKYAIIRCQEILEKNKNKKESNDIIVFVPTQNDTIKGCEIIKSNDTYCVEVFSKMTNENKELAINKDLYKKSGYKTKIIFATNVAESSITFDGLVYVVDSGLELVNEFDSYYNRYNIKKAYTTQSQIIQRIGRTGRTMPGIAYHLYTKDKFNSLVKYPDPNILVMDLTEYILSLINYGQNIKNFITIKNDLITIPKDEQIINSLYKLIFTKCLKIVNDKSEIMKLSEINLNHILDGTLNGSLTKIGINILKFKSSQLLTALAIIMAKYLDCQKEMIIIMAIIEVIDGKIDSLFVYDDEKKLKKYFKNYSYTASDHLTLLNIYNLCYKKNKKKFLHRDTFRKIDNRIIELTKYARQVKGYSYMNNKYELITIEPYSKIENNILYILGKSHSLNMITNYNTVNFRNNSKATIELSKITTDIKKSDVPFKYAIFHSLVNRFNRQVFTCVTKIPNFIKII